MKSAIAPEVKQEILEKVKKGEKVPALGKQYGISEKTIYYWLRMRAIGTVSLLELNKLKKENQQLKEWAFAEWKRRIDETKMDSAAIETRINELKVNQQATAEKVKIVSTQTAMKIIEDELAKFENEIKAFENQKNNTDDEIVNMEIVMDNVSYFLEHLEELLLGSSNPLKRAAYFGLLFDEAPTYNDLVFGTPKLAPYIMAKR